MAQYTCGVCGYTYDEAAGVLFSELSDSWLCPVCSAGKQQFTLTSSPAKETILPRQRDRIHRNQRNG